MTEQPFELRITATARRQLTENLPTSVAFAAYAFVRGPLIQHPKRVGKQLMPPLDDRFSARLGTYRVVYLVDDEFRLVTVVAVALRADICRT